MPVAGLATSLDRAPRTAKIAMMECCPQHDALPQIVAGQILK
jgi:hypothetical protein